MMVLVQPTGMLRKSAGAAVSMEPMRWWSMISMISACSRPSTAWLRSLWSTRMTCFFLAVRRLGVLTRPLYLPSSSMTGKKRWRLEAMVFLASSTEVLTESLTMPSRCILALTGMDMQMRREAA